MPIESCLQIEGRGTVVTGRIERGKVKVGDELEIVGIRSPQRTTATGIEMFRKQLESGIVYHHLISSAAASLVTIDASF